MDKYQAQLKLAQKRLDAMVTNAGRLAPKLTAARGDMQQLLNVVTRFDRGLDYVVFKQRAPMIVPSSLVPFRDEVNGLSLVLNDAEIFDQLSLKTLEPCKPSGWHPLSRADTCISAT